MKNNIMVSINKGRISFLTDPSEKVKHFYNILVAFIFFFIAQLITSVWNQPFWATGLDFPGQIVAMVFVWLVMCAVQVLLCQPGEGLERLYHRYIKAPVSGQYPARHLTKGTYTDIRFR